MPLPVNQIIQGNCLDVLKTLPAENIDVAITSPPYWSLRAYQTEPQVWDGSPECQHEWGEWSERHDVREKPIAGKTRTTDRFYGEPSRRFNGNHEKHTAGQFCSRCRAWRGELGLEPSIDLYIKHLSDVFDEVKRVMKKEATCWVNLADTYAGSGGAGGDYNAGGLRQGQPRYKQASPEKIPEKSLCLVPFRFAIEMVNRGWILRNTILWHKPNCLPSSAKDRFTVDFEYVFLLAKSKRYFFEPQYEPCSSRDRRLPGVVRNRLYGYQGKYAVKPIQTAADQVGKARNQRPVTLPRLRRSVWSIPTQPYRGAHFSTYPEALVEIPIRAGCPQFVCCKCGKARKGIFQPTPRYANYLGRGYHDHRADITVGMSQPKRAGFKSVTAEYVRVGYTDCGCKAGWDNGIVLDPFVGSGTTALVASKNGRRFIGIELQRSYVEMAEKRIAPLLRQARLGGWAER